MGSDGIAMEFKVPRLRAGLWLVLSCMAIATVAAWALSQDLSMRLLALLGLGALGWCT